MKLMTKEIAAKIPWIGATESERDRHFRPTPLSKIKSGEVR